MRRCNGGKDDYKSEYAGPASGRVLPNPLCFSYNKTQQPTLVRLQLWMPNVSSVRASGAHTKAARFQLVLERFYHSKRYSTHKQKAIRLHPQETKRKTESQEAIRKS